MLQMQRNNKNILKIRDFKQYERLINKEIGVI